MTGDLFINNVDASTMGIAMGTGFLGSLLSPASLKDFVENDDPTKDGKEVIIGNPKIASRDLTLTFVIYGDSASEHLRRYNIFVALLQTGGINIQVPAIGSDIYKLKYRGSSGAYILAKDRTTSNITVKFEEPNPTDRSATVE